MAHHAKRFEVGAICVIAVSEHKENYGRVVVLTRATNLRSALLRNSMGDAAWYVQCMRGVKFSGFPVRKVGEEKRPEHSVKVHGADSLIIAQWKLRLLLPEEQTLIHDGIEYLVEHA